MLYKLCDRTCISLTMCWYSCPEIVDIAFIVEVNAAQSEVKTLVIKLSVTWFLSNSDLIDVVRRAPRDKDFTYKDPFPLQRKRICSLVELLQSYTHLFQECIKHRAKKQSINHFCLLSRAESSGEHCLDVYSPFMILMNVILSTVTIYPNYLLYSYVNSNLSHTSSIPPLMKTDGSLAINDRDKCK